MDFFWLREAESIYVVIDSPSDVEILLVNPILPQVFLNLDYRLYFVFV